MQSSTCHIFSLWGCLYNGSVLFVIKWFYYVLYFVDFSVFLFWTCYDDIWPLKHWCWDTDDLLRRVEKQNPAVLPNADISLYFIFCSLLLQWPQVILDWGQSFVFFAAYWSCLCLWQWFRPSRTQHNENTSQDSLKIKDQDASGSKEPTMGRLENKLHLSLSMFIYCPDVHQFCKPNLHAHKEENDSQKEDTE